MGWQKPIACLANQGMCRQMYKVWASTLGVGKCPVVEVQMGNVRQKIQDRREAMRHGTPLWHGPCWHCCCSDCQGCRNRCSKEQRKQLRFSLELEGVTPFWQSCLLCC